MNSEIIRTLTPIEYISAFLNKNVRLDKRDLKQKRKAGYQTEILDSFSTSATSLLGNGNKLISVLKASQLNNINESSSLNISLEYLGELPKVTYSVVNITAFINKLIHYNLNFELPFPSNFTLFITILNLDGNIYDCISNLISNMFKGANIQEGDTCLNRHISLKKKFVTNTFCIIEDKLILDPTQEEAEISNFYFTLIKFESDEFFIHKIKGGAINVQLLEEAFNLC
jgi:exosome complex RNA-binding protein Rrp42 (RNase PH superfamily)